MPGVRTIDRKREASALLQADLMTCCACTRDGLGLTARYALAAVYRRPQRVSVERYDPSNADVSIVMTGPDFFGVIKLPAPSCD